MKSILAILVLLSSVVSAAEKLNIRIKDVSRIQGTKDYFVTGYGIVTGLNNTGDSDAEMIQHTVNNVLKNFKIDIDESQIKANNLAAVAITARIRGGSHKDDMVSCTVTTLGDATSLLGGTLLMSPVFGTDGELWGVAQGTLLVGGGVFGEKGPGGDVVVKNVPTSGSIVNGLQLQRDVGSDEYLRKDEIVLVLKDPDFASTQSMTDVINEKFTGSSIASGKGRVRVKVPQSFMDQGKVISFISQIQSLRFQTDMEARVIVNEKTGTIVVNGEVKVSEVAISHSNIVVRVEKEIEVSQPLPDSQGQTVVYENTNTNFEEEAGRLKIVPPLGNVKDLVESLNKLGVTPRDMMSIFLLLQESGALHAELIAK